MRRYFAIVLLLVVPFEAQTPLTSTRAPTISLQQALLMIEEIDGAVDKYCRQRHISEKTDVDTLKECIRTFHTFRKEVMLAESLTHIDALFDTTPPWHISRQRVPRLLAVQAKFEDAVRFYERGTPSRT